MGYTQESKTLKVPDRYVFPIRDVVEFLVEAAKDYPILEIGIAGSLVRGDIKPTSDIDIVLVVSEVCKPLRLHCIDPRCLEREDVPVDVIYMLPGWKNSEHFFTKSVYENYIPIWRRDN